ncbi:hypothetical protein QBC43DRAFT_336748 [Cladorrhinum sp. PSN259]|nr:hypothetical protein QBC43DRAFT_336748 [Cladorrhinum sp. PSN259]
MDFGLIGTWNLEIGDERPGHCRVVDDNYTIAAWQIPWVLLEVVEKFAGNEVMRGRPGDPPAIEDGQCKDLQKLLSSPELSKFLLTATPKIFNLIFLPTSHRAAAVRHCTVWTSTVSKQLIPSQLPSVHRKTRDRHSIYLPPHLICRHPNGLGIHLDLYTPLCSAQPHSDMLRRPYQAGSALRLRQTCELVSGSPLIQPAKRSFVTLHSARHVSRPYPANPTWTIATRSLATSQPCLKSKRPQTSQTANAGHDRFARPKPSSGSESGVGELKEMLPRMPDLAEITAAVDRVTKGFMAHLGIPSEHMTLTALQACAQLDVRRVADSQERQSKVAAAEDRPTSHLLGLEGGPSRVSSMAGPSSRPEDIVDKVSDAAYAIVTHPAVVITSKVLEEYVRLQSQLGRPQTLPHVLGLYASKPKPKEVGGTINYVEVNPNKAEKAVDPAIADAALDAAIEARDMEAAIGVLENTYSAKAFLRSKLIKKAILPATVVAATPVALYVIATELAKIQNSWDPATATNIAFVGVLCYVGFTASIGMVAAFTQNDQMKRVTWAIGTPLRHRWLYEEERVALDKIACAFGFSEEYRFGEEEGEEFLWLREYILRKSMILDAVDLMPETEGRRMGGRWRRGSIWRRRTGQQQDGKDIDQPACKTQRLGGAHHRASRKL